MTLIMALALAAFVFKAYWWYESRKYTWADARWYCLLGAFSLLNIIEFFGNDLFRINASPMFFIQSYFAIGMFSYCAIYAFILDQRSLYQNRIIIIMLACAAGITIGLFNGIHLLNGYQPDTYPLRSIKGEYFFIVYAFSFLSMLGIFLTMIFNYRQENNALSKIEYLSIAWAFFPFLAVVAWSSGSYWLGYSANTSGMVPVATSVFLAVIIYTKSKDPALIQSDPRKHLPASEESRYYSHIEHTVTQCAISGLEIPKAMVLLEAELLRYRIVVHIKTSQANGKVPSKRSLAMALGWSRPKLDRRLEKYHLQEFFNR